MRHVLIDARTALRDRLAQPEQVAPSDATAELPAYVESFLAHLRLLVGLPFEYLVPDARLLPPESIRFFHIDRSWTDRMIDGALAVGKVGSREQAHHQAHHPAIQQRLDLTQREVRSVQRGKVRFVEARAHASAAPSPNGRITGFLLRSAAVSGWPRVDVRAYDDRLPDPIDATVDAQHRLRTLRQERLSAAVLLVLFEGIPELVVIEEPHQGVQLGVQRSSTGWSVVRRDASGVPDPNRARVNVPVRATHGRVLALTELRKRLHALDSQRRWGGADLAVQLLTPPFRQRFEGRGGVTGGGGPLVTVASALTDAALVATLEGLVR